MDNSTQYEWFEPYTMLRKKQRAEPVINADETVIRD